MQFATGGKIIVVALGVHHADRSPEPAKVALFQSGQGGARVAEHIVQVIAERVIEQAHARVHVLAKAGRLAEVLAKKQRIVARGF